MRMNECPICGVYVGGDSTGHQCLPSWKCRENEGGVRLDVYALGADEAAEMFARKFDAEFNYPYVNGDEDKVDVFVDGEWVTFYIEAYSKPIYTATLCEL